MRLHFSEGWGHTGTWEKGRPDHWYWSRKGGDYFKNQRDFFDVHWEIYNPESNYGVRLHVESPRYDMDPVLNDLKAEVVTALLASDVRRAVKQAGFTYCAGGKTTQVDIRRNKSTEAFRIVLAEEERAPTHRDDIESVHAALGPLVDGVLDHFTNRLRQYFP